MSENSIMMYGVPPIDAPENPWRPLSPSPFTPGVQQVPQYLPTPGLTVSTGGPEPIEQILSRVRARIGEIKAELTRAESLKIEMAQLERMLRAYDAPDTEVKRTPQAIPQDNEAKEK